MDSELSERMKYLEKREEDVNKLIKAHGDEFRGYEYTLEIFEDVLGHRCNRDLTSTDIGMVNTVSERMQRHTY